MCPTFRLFPSVADFNADGKPDLVVEEAQDPYPNPWPTSVQVLAGEGSGKFAPPQNFSANTQVRFAQALSLSKGARPGIVFLPLVSDQTLNSFMGLLFNQTK